MPATSFGAARIIRDAGERETFEKSVAWTDLHGDGLLKFQGGAHELSHLAAIVSQLVIVFAVGQMKFFYADEFDLKFCDLFESERGESGLRFAAQHLADEDRESAAVGKHGLCMTSTGNRWPRRPPVIKPSRWWQAR